MKKIGLFWGSTSDNTKIASEFMQEYLEDKGFEVESHDIGDVDVEALQAYLQPFRKAQSVSFSGVRGLCYLQCPIDIEINVKN